MAPTIGRQWRGGAEDYAALCDYCDVRYLRSQLQKQPGGRLACSGPGTNSCAAGRDEVSLDKINADIMRDRRRPTAARGGRFDRIRVTVAEIFGAQLVEYWDASLGVVATSAGRLTSWTGQKLGAVFSAGAGGLGRWDASVPEFYGRPAVQITDTEFDTGVVPLMPAGARPYVAAVTAAHAAAVCLSGGAVKAVLGGSVIGADVAGQYMSVVSPVAGTILSIPIDEVGGLSRGRLQELDATGPLAWRVGTAEVTSSVDSPTDTFWNRVTLQQPSKVTLVVLCNNPSPLQVEEFQALARSYAVMRP